MEQYANDKSPLSHEAETFLGFVHSTEAVFKYLKMQKITDIWSLHDP